MNQSRYSSNPYAAWGPMWPFVAPWIQAMQAWAAAMGACVPGAGAPPSWNPYSTCGPSPAATRPRVSVKVSSKSPTEVSASLDPCADEMRLTADALTSDDQRTAPAIKDVSIASECGHVQVSVAVPDTQPAGRYKGIIRDSAGCRRGEVTVVISQPTKPAP